MNRSKEQRIAAQAARRTALQAYFTGEGRTARLFNFVGQGLHSSVNWFARCVLYSSWALVCLVLFGFGEGDILPKVHAWLTAMPVEQLRGLILSMAGQLAVDLAQIALFAGFVERLVQVASTPTQSAAQVAVAA